MTNGTINKIIEDFGFKIGYKYKIFFNKNNLNNQTIHLRGIVDSDVFVYCYWRKSKKYYDYKVESAGYLAMLIKDGNISCAGKSNIKLEDTPCSTT